MVAAGFDVMRSADLPTWLARHDRRTPDIALLAYPCSPTYPPSYLYLYSITSSSSLKVSKVGKVSIASGQGAVFACLPVSNVGKQVGA